MSDSAAEEQSVILELYKLAAEMADRTSARRAAANSFFATLNVALATVIGLVTSARTTSPGGAVATFDPFGLCVAAAAGIVLSVTWWALLRYYRRLNRAKFAVIVELEKHLPAQPYTNEWSVLHPEEAQATTTRREGWLSRLWAHGHHREASVVEQVVPFVFAALYIVLMIRALWLR